MSKALKGGGRQSHGGQDGTVTNGKRSISSSSSRIIKPSSIAKNGKIEGQGKDVMNAKEGGKPFKSRKDAYTDKSLRVGVLQLKEGALDIGDDGRSIVWLDIDNTLYKKSTKIAELMTKRIKAYFLSLGLSEEETQTLHKRYYKEYGLAIRGLVMHHEIDALDYDAKCDAALPLDEILRPDEDIKTMLKDLDLTKCRIWALTNAYKTHALRVLRLLELDQFIEGIIYCDYANQNFACKPEKEFYDGALQIVGMHDTKRCFFVDDSALNIRAAKKLGWGNCVLFDEEEEKSNLDNFDTSVFNITGKGSHFDEEKVKQQVQKLDSFSRVRLLNVVLDACYPGDIKAMQNALKKQVSLSCDLINTLPDHVLLKIFEKLHIHELLRCRLVSKRWNTITKHAELWRSHALVLATGDSSPLLPPSNPTGWENRVKGLYFRERNWAKGICQSITLMSGHTGFVTAMKLKGRKTLVTGSYDETIRVWDLETGVCKKVLKAKAIACLDFLSEEGILAAGLYDTGRVMIWDMRTWTLLQTLSGHNRGIRNVALNSDYLVSVGQDKAIVVWDWKSGTKIVRFGQQSNVSLGVSIVDRDKIVAVTVDGIIRTFDLSSPKKEMIGQFDVTKLAPNLANRLSGLKDGSNMMQWFAAHRNTITMGSQNVVIHLQWQEHIVPVKKFVRARCDSNASTISNSSTVASNVKRRSSMALSNSVTSTPRRSTAGTINHSVQPSPASKHSRSPSLLNDGPLSPRSIPQKGRISKDVISETKASPSPIARKSSISAKPTSTTPIKSSRTSSRLSSTGTSRPTSPLLSPIEPNFAMSPRLKSSETADGTKKGDSTPQPGTRIAPNLSVAPLILSVIATPDGAVGCVDAAKRRIVCSSRFSSRAGADRRLYTTTFEEQTNKIPEQQDQTDGGSNENGTKTTRSETPTGSTPIHSDQQHVVPIGGCWQSMSQELATHSKNPMSLVLDPDHCVVGTSEGLVYCMNFVGAEYSKGWTEEEEETKGENNEEKSIVTSNEIESSTGKENETAVDRQKEDNQIEKVGDAVIKDLTELRQHWNSLFKTS